MASELMEALNIIEKEKDINKEVLIKTIEESLVAAYKNNFDKAENVTVEMDRETGEFLVFAQKEVVDIVTDKNYQISIEDAKEMSSVNQVGDVVNVEIKSKEFGRIAAQNAKNVILQRIREEERKSIYERYKEKEFELVSGTIQRISGQNVYVNLGKIDAIMIESEAVKSERYRVGSRMRFYVKEVKDTPKGPKVSLSRTNTEFIKRLFESEVPEVAEGIVEIKAIVREPGMKTKMAVVSHNEKVDPVGTCIGASGNKVNIIVDEINGEKIDIINWSDNQAMMIENALMPAKVISVIADAREMSAKVVVPDQYLSLAIGKGGLNAKLAAKITGFKIDIKSESVMYELEEQEYQQNADDEQEADVQENNDEQQIEETQED